MIRRTFHEDGSFIDEEEAIPECGDYCEHCGDCLYCYSEDGCGGEEGVEHSWVVYD